MLTHASPQSGSGAAANDATPTAPIVPGPDSLLAALVYIARAHAIPVSVEAVTAGLPMPEDGRLNPPLFVRAAERVGLEAKIHARDLSQIPRAALPVVLILKTGAACILVDRDSAGQASVVFPDLGDGVTHLPLADLTPDLSGRLIYVKPRVDAAPNSAAQPKSERAWLWDVMRLMKAEYGLTIASAASINLLGLTVPLFTMNVYDRVLPNSAFPTLWVLGAGVFLALIFDIVLRTLRGTFVDIAGRRADILLSSTMFEHLVNMKLASKPRSAGEIANRLRDFEVVRDFFGSATIATFTDLAFMAVFLFVIALVGGPLAIVPVVATVIVLAIGFAVQPALKAQLEQHDKESSLKHGHLVETIFALEAVKTLNAQGQVQRQWDRTVSASAHTMRRTRLLSLLTTNVTGFVQQMVTIAIILWGAHLFAEKAISMGAIIATVMLSARAVAPLGGLAGMFVRVQQALVSLRALDSFMALESELTGAPNLHRRIERGEIEFRNVTFSYPGSKGQALNGISFKVAAGERVGILGRVGSGKTTLCRLLIKLYDPKDGTVLIDGVDVRQYHPAEVRRGVGVILQDIALFSGTIRQNIAFGTPWAEDAQILRAARLSGADEFIRENPQGFDLQVGERGQFLSGGQRQAVALARSLFHDPPILFLDEPTSAVDPRFENDLIKRLKRVLGQAPRTLLVSTHRRSLVDLVDRLIVLDRGGIIADGPKDKVLEHLKGLG